MELQVTIQFVRTFTVTINAVNDRTSTLSSDFSNPAAIDEDEIVFRTITLDNLVIRMYDRCRCE